MKQQCVKCGKDADINDFTICLVCETPVCDKCVEEEFESTCVCKHCGKHILGLHGLADDLRDTEREFDNIENKEMEIISIMREQYNDRH